MGRFKRIKGTSAKPPDRSEIIAMVLAGYDRAKRQLMALVPRCHDPEGHVLCTVNFEVTLSFNVQTEAERDAIAQAIQREMAGRLHTKAAIITDPGRQIADLIAKL